MTSKPVLEVISESFASYRRMIDATVDQLSDEALFCRPGPHDQTESRFNSVAVLLHHLGGNLTSRWTDFRTTDGEKETRHRDREFDDWAGSRAELLAYFDGGWSVLTEALSSITETELDECILIRGESHTILQALLRCLTHVAYHTGQMALVARMVHDGDWQWLTVAPNQTERFNRATWGTSRSRAVFGDAPQDESSRQ